MAVLVLVGASTVAAARGPVAYAPWDLVVAQSSHWGLWVKIFIGLL